MNRASYAETIEDGSDAARRREQAAFDYGVKMLTRLREGDATRHERLEAMLYMRRLWSFLIEDLGSPANELPEELRSTLISIGVWMIKESEHVTEGQLDKLEDMIAAMTAIRNGLE
jgi:flagellar biosynthesis activator protein FlaF